MELESLYRAVVEHSTDGIWVFDLDGRTVHGNAAIASLFGTGQDEFCRLTYFECLDEGDREQFADHLVDLRAGRRTPGDVEVRYVRPDGTTFWGLVSETLLPATAEHETLVLHQVADYDDRRQVFDELAVSRRQLAEGQAIARIGSWEWDLGSDRISGSDGLATLFRLDDDYFPTDYASVLESVHPDDRAAVGAAVEEALHGGDGFVFEARFDVEDTWLWVRGRGIVDRAPDGHPRTVTGTFQDINEAKQAQVALEDQVVQNQLLRAIASAANEAGTLHDVLAQARQLVLLHDDWSRARAFVPSVDEGGEVVDMHPLYVADDDRADDEATPEETAVELRLARSCLAERTAQWDDARLTIGFPVLFEDEVYAVITLTSTPPLLRHTMIASMVDQVALQLAHVVEREQAERALADARDAAMEASRQKSEFLATMSHEIRTPLNGVIGLTDLLLRTRLDPRQLQLASGVQVASRSLLGLINGILDFSKIEAGKLQLESVDFAVRPVFDQVLSVLGESAREKGLDLVAACDATVPDIVCGDPVRFAQVLLNLTANAVKFTEDGEVVVRASADRTGDRVRITVNVADTGIGIESEAMAGLFEVFTQADTSTTRVHGGTGLGLAISREIVCALGGEIGVESVPGCGSVFTFSMLFEAPVGAVRDADDDHARRHLAGRRMLVVGAEHHRELLAPQLHRWALQADGATTVGEAVARLLDAASAGTPYDVVLVDFALPGRDGNGLTLARELRGLPACGDMTLVLLDPTGDLDDEFVRQMGITECLVKPLAVSALRNALLTHVAEVGPRSTQVPAVVGLPSERRRILVVEDNPVNQLVAVGLLESMGYDADTADDGVLALEALAAADYDLVLMDVQMPRLDGYATTREIRAREGADARLPVVAMTAAAIEGERERCLAAGMDDFLTKPVDPEALAAVLATRLGRGRSAPARRAAPTPAPVPVDGLDLERLDMLRDMADGDTSYLDRAIGNFVAGSPDLMAAIRSAVEDADVPALQMAAHRLAGSAGNLGVLAVSTAARELEHLADAGSARPADGALERLAATLERGRAAVLSYRESYRPDGLRAEGAS